MSVHEDNRPDDFPPDLKAFEAALSGLIPAASRLDRDRLMYQAGAASAAPATNHPAIRTSRHPMMLWPAATAALLVVALGLGTLVALRRPEDRIVYVDRPAAKSNQGTSPALAVQFPRIEPAIPRALDPPSAGYLALREQVLRLGVEAIEPPRHPGEQPDHHDVRNRALLNQFLGS
jgi:hypothetical protein